MERNKYIAAIVLGFLAILAIGVISIKLFRAKRSTAPEHDAMVTITPTPSPAAVGAGAFAVPEVVAELGAGGAVLPPEVLGFFSADMKQARGVLVRYADQRTGVRVRHEIPLSLAFMNQAIQKQGAPGKDGVFYEVGSEQTRVLFPLRSPQGVAVLTLTSVSADKTELVGYLIYERS